MQIAGRNDSDSREEPSCRVCEPPPTHVHTTRLEKIEAHWTVGDFADLLEGVSVLFHERKNPSGKTMLWLLDSETNVLHPEECDLFAKVRWQDFSAALQWDEGHVGHSER